VHGDNDGDAVRRAACGVRRAAIIAERFVGSIRRELLDRLLIIN
jgi:hypothetical protein